LQTMALALISLLVAMISAQIAG
jgi:hypothetical protein